MAKTDIGSLSSWSVLHPKYSALSVNPYFLLVLTRGNNFSMKLTFGFYKILNVFMAKPRLWSSLSDFSVPKGAFNNCSLNFRSHLTGYLFISIVERGVGFLSASFSGACCGRILFPLPLQNQRILIAERELGCDSTVSEARSMYSQVLSQLGEQTQRQPVTQVSTRRKGRMRLWGSPNGEQFILFSGLRKMSRLLS